MKLLIKILVALNIINAIVVNAEDVILVNNGQTKCVIVVEKSIMEKDSPVSQKEFKKYKAEIARRRVRESVNDLALYMKKISGATIPIVHKKQTGGVIPVYIGAPAEKLFGRADKTDSVGQGFRVIVKRDEIGLVGQSPLAVSYAIYELLDRWGVRWYMPTEMGEYVPLQKKLCLPVMNYSYVPSTLYRNIWWTSEKFRRRNRQGGQYLAASHSYETYITEDDRNKHPEWRAVINGKSHPVKVKWTHPGVIRTIAERILEKDKKEHLLTYSLSPMDAIGWDESEDPKYDAGDWDPICNTVSKSDRLIYACNQIAKIIEKKNPEIMLGVLAYVDYTRAPIRENIHPNLVPQIAPITYNRHHPMTWTEHPDKDILKKTVEGWGKKAKHMSYYAYAYNLAEVSAPCPFLTKWATDLPIIFKNNCSFWMPETTANFETAMPIIYLGMRLSWNKDQKPEMIFKNLFKNFYGSASASMEKYWHIIDNAWIDSKEYSGGVFGYLKIFTPEVLKQARQTLDKAKKDCKTPMEYRRVELANESFSLLELLIKMRWDLVNAKFHKLAEDAETWRGGALYLAKKYRPQYCFTGNRWASTWAVTYFDFFSYKPFKDSARIYKDFKIIGTSIRNWKYQQDPSANDDNEKKKKPEKRTALGEKLGWMKTDFDDSKWKTTDVGTETWSRIGFHHYMGLFWYRTKVKLPKIPSGKQVILWIPSTDGKIKLFVNGKLAKVTDKEGKTKDVVESYCTPINYDITSAIKPGKENQITILANRVFVSELGVGGLLAPPLICVKK